MRPIKFKGNLYPIGHPDIVFNCKLNKYLHKDSTYNRGLLYGIINIEEEKFIYGYFQRNLYNNCRLKLENSIVFCNNIEVILKTSYFVWDPNLLMFVYNKEGNYTPEIIKKVAEDRAYNIEDNLDYKANIDYYNNYDIKIDSNLLKYKKLLKNKTYGVEIETSQGRVYPWTLLRYGFSECRDGSIDNIEYVSVPMEGLKGLQSISNFCNENKNLIETDYKCSLHVHIGNIRTDKWFIIALYKCLYNLQQDYFEYFPHYKKDNEILNKNKHYTKPLLPLACKNYDLTNKSESLKQLKNDTNNIFSFLTNGILPCQRFNRSNRKHPKNQKWNIENRYFIYNFVNLLFGNRKTLEFRIHENTFNSTKIINQILLSISIIDYVENNIEACLEGRSLETVAKILNYSIKDDKLYEDLINYYIKRRDLFNSDAYSRFERYCKE